MSALLSRCKSAPHLDVHLSCRVGAEGEGECDVNAWRQDEDDGDDDDDDDDDYDDDDDGDGDENSQGKASHQPNLTHPLVLCRFKAGVLGGWFVHAHAGNIWL